MEEIIFPNQIRLQRKRKGISMQALADHLGVSLSAVSKIEKGYRRLNQEQLISVAELTDCALQDLYVNELNSTQEVVQAWRREQERRTKINTDAGLKILGAALRYIRTNKDLTLMEVAESADMTLSVYHRIEMGQREVSDKEFNNISKAFAYTPEKLKAEIQKLKQSGLLQDIMDKTDAKYKSLATPKGSHVSMYGIYTAEMPSIKVYGSPTDNGNILIDMEDEDAKEIVCPFQLANKREAYAINLCTRRLGNLLPNRAILFVDPQEMASIGDIVLYYISENEAMLLSIRDDETGGLYGLRYNPDERVELAPDRLSKIHKVVAINL
ncbi:MAG: transcriptional regulator [Alphaproteobacteria bacterium]|nr:transcriptional regulator [Alphaproteobacteria bacterium]